MSAPRRPGGLLAVRICPADVGRRVTLRHRVDGASTQLTDVVGLLVSWSGGELVVRRRDDSVHAVAARELVAAKVVSPEVSAYELEAIAAEGWPPLEHDTLGEWTLRWAHGVSRRGNSVRVGGDPGVPLVQALAYVQDWYAARSTRPMLQVPDPWVSDQALDDLGWTAHQRTVVMTRPSDLAVLRIPNVVSSLLTEPDKEWLSLVPIPATDLPGLARILTAPPERTFVYARDPSGMLVGIGRASISGSGAKRWVGITNLNTAASHRGQGIGSAVVGMLCDWGIQRGAANTYLEVEEENVHARRLYSRLGFVPHHTHVYRSPSE